MKSLRRLSWSAFDLASLGRGRMSDWPACLQRLLGWASHFQPVRTPVTKKAHGCREEVPSITPSLRDNLHVDGMNHRFGITDSEGRRRDESPDNCPLVGRHAVFRGLGIPAFQECVLMSQELTTTDLSTVLQGISVPAHRDHGGSANGAVHARPGSEVVIAKLFARPWPVRLVAETRQPRVLRPEQQDYFESARSELLGTVRSSK